MKKLVVSFIMVMVLLSMTGCGKREDEYDRWRFDYLEDRVVALYERRANPEEFDYDYTVDKGIRAWDSNTKEYWARISIPNDQGGQTIYECTYEVYQKDGHYRVSTDEGVSYFGPCEL